MNPSPSNPDDEALDEAAAEWLCEREDGFTPERAQAFAAWRERDPRHAAAVRRVEHTLRLLDEMPSIRAPLEQRFRKKEVDQFPGRGTVATFRRLLWLGGVAATLMIALAWWHRNARPDPYPTLSYATDRSIQQSVALTDGTVMDINVDSDVAVHFTPGERRVTLRRGAAHFQVAHNPARPFIVTAGNISVRAVGTAFEVRLTPESVDVVVVEGKVELGSRAASPTPATAGSLPLLSAGVRAQVTRNDADAPPSIQEIGADEIRALLTWRASTASFTDVPLRDVITRLNRRNSMQLVLADAELGNRKIGGRIPLDQVDAFVRLLEQDGDVVADRATPGRITLHRAR